MTSEGFVHSPVNTYPWYTNVECSRVFCWSRKFVARCTVQSAEVPSDVNSFNKEIELSAKRCAITVVH